MSTPRGLDTAATVVRQLSAAFAEQSGIGRWEALVLLRDAANDQIATCPRGYSVVEELAGRVPQTPAVRLGARGKLTIITTADEGERG